MPATTNGELTCETSLAAEIQSRPQFALRVLDAVTISDSKTRRKNAATIRRITGRMIDAGTIEIRESNGES